MKQILHCFFLMSTFPTLAQTTAALPAGARGAGMANASVTFTDIHSAFSNPAGLAHLEMFTATAFAERRFLLSELQSVCAAAGLPTRSGTFGLTLHHVGFEGLSEQKLGVAYARKLLDGLSIGSQILLLNTSIPEYGSNMNLTFELGFIATLLPKLQLGAHVYSPMQVEFANGENLPTIFKIGAAYLPSEQLTCVIEIEKDIAFPARTKLGIEYQIVERAHVRTGLATNPTSLAFGVGYRLPDNLALDVAAAYHQFLGFTPTVGFAYQFKKAE
jgi:hypothetical protein